MFLSSSFKLQTFLCIKCTECCQSLIITLLLAACIEGVPINYITPETQRLINYVSQVATETKRQINCCGPRGQKVYWQGVRGAESGIGIYMQNWRVNRSCCTRRTADIYSGFAERKYDRHAAPTRRERGSDGFQTPHGPERDWEYCSDGLCIRMIFFQNLKIRVVERDAPHINN